MNWIKQNKFEAILLLVVLILAIGVFLYGNSQSKAFKDSVDRFESADSEVGRLEGVAPYPTKKSVESRRGQTEGFQGKVIGLQESLLSYRPEDFKKMSPAEFTDRLNGISAKLKELYGSKIEYPDEWQVGFESYTASPPKDEATDFLNYQLSVMEWLFTELAAAEPSALLNVYRPKLPIEAGKSMEPEGSERGNRRSRPRRGNKSAAVAEPFYALPVQISFRGKESSLRKFLEGISGSEEYFVAVRNMRVINSEQEPPKESTANFPQEAEEEEEEEDGGIFGTFGFSDEETEEEAEEEEVEEAAIKSERVLGQILGAEELNVFLEMEILLFRDDAELPEMDK